MSRDPGTVVSFYSYKGGTGRTMALANVAWIMASRGRRVLVVDWDLEAPGLHRYFYPFLLDKEVRSTDGVIDLFWRYATAALDPDQHDSAALFAECTDVSMHVAPVRWPFAGAGALHVLPAGRQDDGYAERVELFDWNLLYRKLGGGAFIEALRTRWAADYDFVLVDSRTGLADTAGICSIQLPDVLVDCMTLNGQSIDGAVAVAERIIAARPAPETRPVRIIPSPMRVEDAEQTKMERRRGYLRRRFEPLLGERDRQSATRFWANVEIPYKPFYAYEEILAAFGDPAQREDTLLAAMERLTGVITDGALTHAEPMDDGLRLATLASFESARHGLDTVYVVSGPEDAAWCDWAGWVLSAEGYQVSTLVAGHDLDLPRVISDVLSRACQVLPIVSRNWYRSYATQEIVRAMESAAGSGTSDQLVTPVVVGDSPGAPRRPPFVDLIELDAPAAHAALVDAIAKINIPRGAFGTVGVRQPRFPGELPDNPEAPIRVFVFYVDRDDRWRDLLVRELWTRLLQHGIDARMILNSRLMDRSSFEDGVRQEVRAADFVLVVAPPGHAEVATREIGRLAGTIGLDAVASGQKFVPVILPGDGREWLLTRGTSEYRVDPFDLGGIDRLLRLLTGESAKARSLPGDLPTSGIDAGASATVLRTEVVIDVTQTGGSLRSAVSVAGSPISEQEFGLAFPTVGAALHQALFDPAARALFADLVLGVRPGDWIEVVLQASGGLLSLPIELIEPAGDGDAGTGPLALMSGVTIRRRIAVLSPPSARPLAGPLKVLVAAAAPDQTLALGRQLDAEAELQAILDAVTDATTERGMQVHLLEVAALSQISDALRRDQYHVLHLAANGAEDQLELETEDGSAQVVSADDLITALRNTGRPLPLVVLSPGSPRHRTFDFGAGLVRAGADRVIAMPASCTDRYASAVIAALYPELAAPQPQPVAGALARARRNAERQIRDERRAPYDIPVLLSAGDDLPLIDPAMPPANLDRTPPGTSAIQPSAGRFIRRHRELRQALATLRRTQKALDRHGPAGGVQLIGAGGIGKSALAEQLLDHLRADGWTVVIHKGRWNPAALLTAVAEASPRPGWPSDGDDLAQVDAVGALLREARILLVFDDFERNLSEDGSAFDDPVFDDIFTNWCESAVTGAILVTSRYPLPDDDRLLIRIPVPPLSEPEARRLFLVSDGLRSLAVEDQRLLVRLTHGHPMLIQYLDAVLRREPDRIRVIQARLRDLARAEGVDLRRPRRPGEAIDPALQSRSATILLAELRELLTAKQVMLLKWLAICHAPMTISDLGVVLGDEDLARVQSDISTLADLALVTVGPAPAVHPWTAGALDDPDLAFAVHERGVQILFARHLSRGTRAQLSDRVEPARILARLGMFTDVASWAGVAVDAISGALAVAAYLTEVGSFVPKTEKSWIVMANKQYEAVRAIGNPHATEVLLDRIVTVTTDRRAESPDDGVWAMYHSFNLQRLGDLALEQDRIPEATAHYHRALDIAERFAGRSDESLWQQNKAVLHNRLGHVAALQQRPGEAVRQFESVIVICERLAAAAPDQNNWSRLLSQSHLALGHVLQEVGEPGLATDHYRKAWVLQEQLAADDPADLGLQRDLLRSHLLLGDMAVRNDDLPAAGERYFSALDLATRLADTDESELLRKRDLIQVRRRLGEVSDLAGDEETAAENYRLALSVAESLIGDHADDSDLRHALWDLHGKLGDLASARGDLPLALESYRSGLAVIEPLAAARPENLGWQHDLSKTHVKIADAAAAAGDEATASDHRQRALAIDRSQRAER